MVIEATREGAVMSETIIVNRSLIDAAVKRNQPDGLAKLALKAKVSTSLLSKVRCGKVPKKYNRASIAEACECSEDSVFQVVTATEETQQEAS